ncbi:MAG: hypothetical protein U1E15_10235 [Hyphomicrobiales bacterium]
MPRSRPAKSPVAADGSRDIYVLVNGAPEKRSIKTGSSDGVKTVVKEGELQEGDAVITAQKADRAQ